MWSYKQEWVEETRTHLETNNTPWECSYEFNMLTIYQDKDASGVLPFLDNDD